MAKGWRADCSDEVELPELHCTEGTHQPGDAHDSEETHMVDTIIYNSTRSAKRSINIEKIQTIPGPVRV